MEPFHGGWGAYRRAILRKAFVHIRAVRLNYMGLPRSGKTLFWRRLMGDLLNILEGMRLGETTQPSTGVAEGRGQVVIRTATSSDLAAIHSKVWSLLKDFGEEANMLGQFFEQSLEEQCPSRGSTSLPPLTRVNLTSTSPTTSPPQSPPRSRTRARTDASEGEMKELYQVLSTGKGLEAVKYLLEDLTLLIHTDTGGQAEFLDLHAPLVQGPSFNLLFSRLDDKLDSQFQMYYTDERGISTEKEDSSVTLEELMFQALSSIACFGGQFFDDDYDDSHSSGWNIGKKLLDSLKRLLSRSLHNRVRSKSPYEDEEEEEGEGEVLESLSPHPKSKAMFVGTYRDKVSQAEFERKDALLQERIKKTDFYKQGIVEFVSEDQLMLPVNNMSGSQEEIDEFRRILERVIEKNFERIKVPVSWLMFSLCVRREKKRTLSLRECEEVAEKLNIGQKELKREVLRFLHHHMGVLFYYPEIEGLGDTVICDIQVVYDSASNLVKNTFTFDQVGKCVSERFRETGQFSLSDVRRATSGHTDDLLPLEKLLKLLQHRNVLAEIAPSSHHAREPTFFMPCVLRSARPDRLRPSSATAESDPAPLMLRYDCGYVPMGVFPALIANLVSQRRKGWTLIEGELYKNKVQFHVGELYNTVTLLSHPRYFEISLSPKIGCEQDIGLLCRDVRDFIVSALDEVTSRMNYVFSVRHKYCFECPTHPGREHLCLLKKAKAKCMECLEDHRRPKPILLKARHQIWFDSDSPPESPPDSPPESPPELPGIFEGSLEMEAVWPDTITVPLKLKTLQLIKWKDEKGVEHNFRLEHQTSAKWMDIGIRLGFTFNDLQGWKVQFQGDAVMCWRKVMDSWLAGEVGSSPDYPVTWKGLWNLLRDVQLPESSMDLLEVLCKTSS